MRKRLNNKGYMLVEIILASALAFGLAFYMLEVTLKLKSKNDDLLVETLVNTDKAIISNAIMKSLYERNDFNCVNDIVIEGNKVKIGGKLVTEVTNYATIGIPECINSEYINIKIPLTVIQLPDKDFNIDLYYKIESY